MDNSFLSKGKRALSLLATSGCTMFDTRHLVKVGFEELQKSADSILVALNYVTHKEYYRNIANLFVVKSVENLGLIRVGSDSDGGYIMADCLSESNIAYSLGIGGDVAWDTEMAKKGFDVYMYDHTIDALPSENEKFHFRKNGIGGRNTEKILTLAEIIRRNGHENRRDLVLKMDIEGSEYDAINNADPEVLKQFSQIVIEWHNLLDPVDNGITAAIKKLNGLFQCVHLHGNGAEQRVRIDDRILPDAMEATYLRRTDHTFVDARHTLPLPIDMPSREGDSEIYLGNYMVQH